MRKCILFLLLITICGCKLLECGDDVCIVLGNALQDTITTMRLSYKKFGLHRQYDTLIHSDKKHYTIGRKLVPEDMDWLTNWYNDEDVSQDTMTIFVIKQSVLDNVPWDTIVKNYMILQRYDVPAQYYMDFFGRIVHC